METQLHLRYLHARSGATIPCDASLKGMELVDDSYFSLSRRSFDFGLEGQRFQVCGTNILKTIQCVAARWPKRAEAVQPVLSNRRRTCSQPHLENASLRVSSNNFQYIIPEGVN
jgi:hypothetical protein